MVFVVDALRWLFLHWRRDFEYAWKNSDGFHDLLTKGYILLPFVLVLCFCFLLHTLLLISERCDGEVRESLRPTGAKVWRWIGISAGAAAVYVLLLWVFGLLPLLTAAEVGQLAIQLAFMLLPVAAAAVVYRKVVNTRWPLLLYGGVSFVVMCSSIGFFGEIYNYLYPYWRETAQRIL